jgi:predicted porin
MRKLLLATSALLGASVGIAGVANAGTLTPNAPNPAPGSITVTLNALVEAFAFAGSDSGTNAIPGQKTATYGIATYSRLYPSFDGVLANGLKYGGSMEIRHDNGAATGANSNFYIQREFIYIGADKFGKVYVGAQVQPSELFQSGNPANFNTGGWDGDLPGVFAKGLPYFIDDDNDQANKIVYVSPQFSGFDFGLSFEPNNYGNEYGKPLTRATSVDPALSTGQYGKRVNTVDGAARYQGTFGPVGVKADIAGSYGGSVTSTNDLFGNYQNYSLVGGGVGVTFSGVELDGHIDTGKYGQDLVPLAPGQSGTTAWIVGGSYTFGPVIVGASYYGFDSGITRSEDTAAGLLHGYGIAAGGTYTLAPGASVFLEYLYGHQKANDHNLLGGTDPTEHNTAQAQAFGLGTAFKW